MGVVPENSSTGSKGFMQYAGWRDVSPDGIIRMNVKNNNDKLLLDD